MEKPFYISQLPEKTQAWIKEKTKENFLKDGMSEEEAEQKANDFLDEKVNVAEDFFGKDFYKSIDAIKDNFTPPAAKMEDDNDYKEYEKLVSKNKVTDEDNQRVGELAKILGKKFGSFPGGAKIRNDKGITKKRFDSVKLGDIMKSAYPGNSDIKITELDPDRLSFTGEFTTKDGGTSTTRLGVDDFDWSHLEDFEDEIDTNDNGKVEPDEMADFEKSLTDFMEKNPKGREDIPARTRR